MTIAAIVIPGAILTGIFFLLRACFRCCRKKYVEAKTEIEHMDQDTNVTLEVRIEPN